MENKKLLKFLFKDITEIEELFVEKGGSGFDSFEIEFIQSRFKGAKQIIRILDEKEDEGKVTTEVLQEVQDDLRHEDTPAEITPPAEEPIEKEVVDEQKMEERIEKEEEQRVTTSIDEEEVKEKEILTPEMTEEPEAEEVPEEIQAAADDVELDEEEDEHVNRTIGDSFLKEKSVNDLMSNGAGKLENKLSNTPVASIQSAIGINDRYQYIRELFNGSAETFTKAVNDLDQLQNIQEAVSYLQQNYKWKKTETSLKFVNLVKRRFPNV